MKKLITLGMLMMLGLGAGQAYANDKINEVEVPAAVSAAFEGLYPDTKAEWKTEGANYEGGFKLQGVETSVLFNNNGNVLQTEVEIGISTLPKGVVDYLANNLPGQKIKEASKITDAKGTVTHKVQVKQTNYLFDVNGNFIE